MRMRANAPWLLDEPNAVASGTLCWIGSVVLVTVHHKNITRAPYRGIMAIMMMYLIVDFIIDSSTPNMDDIHELDRLMRHFSTHRTLSDYSSDSSVVITVTEYIQTLLDIDSNTIDPMIDCWMAERESSKQRNNTDLDEVLRITRHKGAMTTLLIGAVMDHSIPTLGLTGEVTQLCDDLCDMRLDRALNISTGATLYYDAGDLDGFILYILRLIDTYPPEETILPSMFIIVVSNVALKSRATSLELKELVDKYTLIKDKFNILDYLD